MWLLLAALMFAVLNFVAIWKGWIWLQFIAKPGVMVMLIVYLWTSVGLAGGAPLWFGLGILFCLVGDVFLLWLDRFFLPGLVSFLIGQIAYIIGFNSPTTPLSLWGLLLAVIIGLSCARVVRRILTSIAEKGPAQMRIPVAAYGVVISLMLLSAMLKFTDSSWVAVASALASLGAFLFLMSDIVLGWNKFVTPIKNGRLLNIAMYHLGQILLVAGVVMQFQ
jgi:alkenylglycerophosphocholine hydrolase